MVTSVLIRVDVFGCLIRHGHGRAQRRPRPRVRRKDRCRTVANSIQPRQRRSALMQNLRVGIGIKPTQGAKVAGLDAHRVVRRLIYGRQTRIGLDRRIGVVAIIGRIPPTKLLVLTRFRIGVHVGNSFLQTVGVDPELFRQLSHRVCLGHKAGLKPLFG